MNDHILWQTNRKFKKTATSRLYQLYKNGFRIGEDWQLVSVYAVLAVAV